MKWEQFLGSVKEIKCMCVGEDKGKTKSHLEKENEIRSNKRVLPAFILNRTKKQTDYLNRHNDQLKSKKKKKKEKNQIQ